MPFLTTPPFRPGLTKEEWNKDMLESTLKYKSDRYHRVIKVPGGFITDYASIPRAFQVFIPKVARHRYAAVVHDWLYNKNNPYKGITRAQADLIFLDAMKDLGVTAWMRWSMYTAVRTFGWALYKGGIQNPRTKYKHKRK